MSRSGAVGDILYSIFANLSDNTVYTENRKILVVVVIVTYQQKKEISQKYFSNDFLEEEEPSKKRLPESGGGRKAKVPDVRETTFQRFLDVRESLKGCLPIKIFRSKWVQVFFEWLKQQSEPIPEKEQLKLSKH